MRKILTLAVIILTTISALNGQTGKTNNPAGNWSFESPEAPAGYNTGTIGITLAEKKYSISISFTGSDYKIPAEQVKVEKDTITCSVYVEGEYVKINLKQDTSTKMTGNAIYSGGEIPLTLTRNNSQK